MSKVSAEMHEGNCVKNKGELVHSIVIMHVGSKQRAKPLPQQVNVVPQIEFSIEKCVGTTVSKQQMLDDNELLCVWPKHFPWLDNQFGR